MLLELLPDLDENRPALTGRAVGRLRLELSRGGGFGGGGAMVALGLFIFVI